MLVPNYIVALFAVAVTGAGSVLMWQARIHAVLKADVGTDAMSAELRTLEQQIATQSGKLGEAEARLSTRRRGEPPVILLDEVAAHLDRPRREALFAELQALFAQCWLTGTERDIFQPLDGWAQFMTAGDGRLLPDTN